MQVGRGRLPLLDGKRARTSTKGDRPPDPEKPKHERPAYLIRHLWQEGQQRAANTDGIHESPGTAHPCRSVPGNGELNCEFRDEQSENYPLHEIEQPIRCGGDVEHQGPNASCERNQSQKSHNRFVQHA